MSQLFKNALLSRHEPIQGVPEKTCELGEQALLKTQSDIVRLPYSIHNREVETFLIDCHLAFRAEDKDFSGGDQLRLTEQGREVREEIRQVNGGPNQNLCEVCGKEFAKGDPMLMFGTARAHKDCITEKIRRAGGHQSRYSGPHPPPFNPADDPNNNEE